MLANLIATIMMALGVATGNVSSNVYKGGNAFYDAEEQHTKPIQKANQEIDNEYTFVEIQTYTETENRINKKYYINNITPNLNTNYYTIYNSTYTLVWDSSSRTTYSITTILKVTTYRNFYSGTIDINQDISITNLNNESAQYTRQTNNFVASNNIDSYIDMNLTPQNIALIKEVASQDTTPNKINQQSNTTNYGTLTNLDANYTNTYTISSIPAETTTYIVLKMQILQNYSSQTHNVGSITPNQIRIRGTIVLPDTNYEVIDVPNVMYTILTMPFSFISTAFNLTVFPGTPYALNFGNLFLTIVAIFILLWLIKKVFH